MDVELVDLPEDQVRISHLKSEVLEIGAVMLDGTYALIDKFHALVRPSHAKGRFETRSKDIERCSDRHILQKVRFGQAMASFCSWVGEVPIDLYMWSESDYRLLYEQARWQTSKDLRDRLLPYLERSIDLQHLFMEILGATACPSLDYALELVHEPFRGTRHHALDDAENTARVFAKLARSNHLPDHPARIPETVRNRQDHLPSTSIAALLGLPEPPKEKRKTPDTPYGIKHHNRLAFSVSAFFTPGLSQEHRILEGIGKVLHGKEKPPTADKTPRQIPTFRCYTTKYFSRSDGASHSTNPETYEESPACDNLFSHLVLGAHFATKTLHAITRREVRAFCKHLHKYQPEGWRKALALLKAVCDQAWKEGFLPFNGEVIEIPPETQEPTIEELLLLFSVPWPNEAHAAIAQTIWLTRLTLDQVTSLLVADARALAIQISQSGMRGEGQESLLSSFLEGREADPYSLAFGAIPPTRREIEQTMAFMGKQVGIAGQLSLERLCQLSLEMTNTPPSSETKRA